MVLRSKLSINKTERRREGGGRRARVGRCIERRYGQTQREVDMATGRRVGGQVEVGLTEAIQAAAINLLMRRCHISLTRWC